MKRKVAIYARVSTEHETQLSALDNQVQYYIIVADTSELCWDFKKTMQIIKKDNEDLFGCGILLYLLTNNFSNDDSNIFIKQNDNMLISNNVWD